MSKVTVKLEGNTKILVYLPDGFDFADKIKYFHGFKWNAQKKCWEIPYQNRLIKQFQALFNDNLELDLSVYLLDFEKMLQKLGYSENTVKSYMGYNLDFLKFAGKKPSEVMQSDIQNFTDTVTRVRKSSALTLNIIVNALRLFYCKLLGKPYETLLSAPKRTSKDIVILDKAEVKRILSAAKNLKHRLMLTLAYATGIRASDLVNLTVDNLTKHGLAIIHEEANEESVHPIKLDDELSEMLNSYLHIYSPGHYLFPGKTGDKPITKRAAEKIFGEALVKCGIAKAATLQTLRHSFAIHALSGGMKLSKLQQALGHKDIQITKRYMRYLPGVMRKSKAS